MPRRSPIILGLISLLGVSALAYQSRPTSSKAKTPVDPAAASVSNPAADTQNDSDPEEHRAEVTSGKTPPTGPDTSIFHLMPDGSSVPALKDSAPDRVKLGIIIFRYKGAQGASASSRSKEQAVILAKKAIETAKSNFEEAVKQGDQGSFDNIGWISQNILERSVEYAVFNLEKGALAPEPVDTPRGLWVVKRLR